MRSHPRRAWTTRIATGSALPPPPIHAGQPGYAPHLDRDGDGVGCET
ncbi:excalibur calcium-binding domain-containing protein [Nocardia flavorosea]|uniref:Excalibur calcium-binding domain-containing protein n=1 Tax=Nocardia flavorosea TaxID=53429 RepID=A0A846YC65_9NOCA|nr:excalibur calcium-binding domain-containing protein [Nocardia flavorosea]NKY54778.1 excalibur calcium-binding domain-containing protein [Nocardia flavorosea]